MQQSLGYVAPGSAYLASHSGPLAVFAPTMLVAPKGRPDEAVAFSAIEHPPFAYILAFDERQPDATPFLPCGGLHNFAQLPYDKRASFEIDLLIGMVAHLFDERNDAVRWLITRAIAAGRRLEKPVGICGQAPSDYPEFAEWLVSQGIDSFR